MKAIKSLLYFQLAALGCAAALIGTLCFKGVKSVPPRDYQFEVENHLAKIYDGKRMVGEIRLDQDTLLDNLIIKDNQ